MRIRCTLQWRHNGHDSVSNHQPHDHLLNRLFRRRSKKTSKLRVTGLCVGNSPGTGEFPPQMASNAENVSIWWRHHDIYHELREMNPRSMSLTLKKLGPFCSLYMKNLFADPVQYNESLVNNVDSDGLVLQLQGISSVMLSMHPYISRCNSDLKHYLFQQVVCTVISTSSVPHIDILKWTPWQWIHVAWMPNNIESDNLTILSIKSCYLHSVIRYILHGQIISYFFQKHSQKIPNTSGAPLTDIDYL